MSPRTAARGFPGPPPPRPLGSTRPAGSASQLCVCGEPPHRRARSAFAAHRMVLPDLCGAYHRPPNPQHPHGKHYANYLPTEKSVSHGIQPKPPQVRAGPKTAVAARELQRREGHLVAAESWGDRASDRLGRRRCRWLDVGSPRQHPRAVCSGLSCAAPTSPAILFLRRDHDARPDRLQALERTGPMFGVAVLVEEAALREYALALLQYFSTPRQRRTSWLCTRRRRSSSRGRRSLSGTACALAAGATS